jgi:2-oxoglutarate/2-oxoacid ferredoxin oxidoreductase subunit alpha
VTLRFMSGNDACVEGALAAGCNFFAGYPITPSTSIAELLSRRLPQIGGKFIQMEDELGSLAAVIGASAGGAKAMTATSGPGFSLMQEHIGYAAMAEIPCVIADVQRLGPSTGQPTSPSQGDVMQARWGTHGDHPIIVLTASSVMEAFTTTVQAFNFSELYRTPVILLLDEVIGQMRERIDLPASGSVEVWNRVRSSVPPEWYFPYEDNSVAVPPMANFGEGYRYHITGLLHDRAGYPTQRLDEINPWLERVFNKIQLNEDTICLYKEEWTNGARDVVISYGATARSARHAVKLARAKRHNVGLLTLQTLWPFPASAVARVARGVRKVIVPEMNRGQLVLEVERVVGQAKVRRVNRADGETISPQQILSVIEEK